MESWRRFTSESESKKMSPDQAIEKEGGAIGMKMLSDLTGMSKEELKDYISSRENLEVHKDGDIIDTSGLSENIEQQVVVDEGKICPKGKAWAMRKYGKWSAYAAMGASKYCKDPNYGKGKKKNESAEIEEGELKKWRDQNWTQSDGTPCGEKKAQSNPKRCKPKSKWDSMTASEKKADNAKKKAGGRKGKQFVKATKKGEVKK